MRGLLIPVCLVLLALHGQAATLWVAPDGKDDAPGTRGQPVSSVQAALARAPSARVLVMPGTYPLDGPIVLGAAHSGAIIEAADPARPPVFQGARRLQGFVPGPKGIWQLQVSFRFEQLWVNGRRAAPARSPNDGWFFATAPEGYGHDPVTDQVVDLSRRAFRGNTSDLSSLAGLTPGALAGVRVVAWHSWSVSRHRISAVQPVAGNQTRLTLRESSLWPFFKFGPVQRFQIENHLGALDSPGEWVQDEGGVVYYLPRPGEDMNSAVVLAPTVTQFLIVDGATDLQVRGLRFRFSGDSMPARGVAGIQAAAEAGAAIVLDRVRRVRLEQLEVAHTGAYAVWIRHDCQDVQLVNSLLEDLGAGGVRVGVTDASLALAAPTSQVQVLNNIVRDGGHVYPDGVGVFVAHAGSNQIESNDISGLNYTGISLGWVWGIWSQCCDRQHRAGKSRAPHRAGPAERSGRHLYAG